MSDHFSGPRAIAGPACDICDFYAFSSPERTGNLVLVTDVIPNAAPTAAFSEAIIYRFRLRPVTIGSTGADASFTLGRAEATLDCTFAAPRTVDGRTVQDGTLRMPDGERIPFVVNDPKGGTGSGVRVYAGHRSDPFFLDFEAMAASMKAGRLMFRDAPVNAVQGANVMALVVEIDCARCLPAGFGSLIAAVGETVAEGRLGIRLERMGRPEIKNLLLNPRQNDTVNRTIELRDLYNLEDPYHVGPDYRDAYRIRMTSNLAVFDALDGTIDWPLDAQGTHPLVKLLLADYLVTDVSKPYAEDSFMEIEIAMLEGRPHASSGGRSLNDDVMDTQFTLYVNAGRGPRVKDNLDGATKRAGLTFPYLADPNPQQHVARPSAPGASNTYTVETGHGHHVHQSFGRYHD